MGNFHLQVEGRVITRKIHWAAISLKEMKSIRSALTNKKDEEVAQHAKKVERLNNSHKPRFKSWSFSLSNVYSWSCFALI